MYRQMQIQLTQACWCINKCTNLGGRHGGQAHRAKVAEVKDSLTKKGRSVSGSEMRIDVDVDRYRYPDIIATKGGVTRFYHIEKTTASSIPVTREIRALRNLGRVAQTFFIPYI